MWLLATATAATPEVRQETHAPTVPGFFLYYPSRAQRSAALRSFVEAARELSRREAERAEE
jgi:hypothetical protein